MAFTTNVATAVMIPTITPMSVNVSDEATATMLPA